MTTSDAALAEAARDSLARILAADTSEWSEGDKRQRMLDIRELRTTIQEFEASAGRASRTIFFPVKPIDIA